MNKIIEYVIGAKDATGNAIKSALSRIKNFAASVGSNLQNIRAGFGMFATAAQKAGQFLAKAFQFEKMTVQFKTLLGNMDAAREHMAMLQEMGDTPPFSMEQFAAASRALMVMTDGALGFRKSLELVGDAAAATGQPVESLAHEVGRAYAIIRDGQPLTRATMALRNMGVLTPEVAQKLDDLQKAGASTTQIWGELEGALKRYKGAMEETEQTADGLIGAIGSQWDDALREFGAACLETSKDALGGLLDWLKQLREDGTISVWANKAGRAFASVAEGAKECGKWIGKVVDAYSSIHDWLEEKGAEIGGYVGTLFGGGTLDDAAKAGAEAGRQVRREHKDRDAENAESDEKARQAGIERAKKAAKDKAEKEREEEEKKLKALEEGQKKIDARNAAEKAKKDAEAAKKAAEEEEKQRKETEKRIAEERKRLWKKDLAEKRQAEQQANKDAADAQSKLQAATQKEQQTWGWYRDKDAWKAQLQEERDDAAAQKQFDKDFEKLKDRKRDWRTAKLSDDDEIVRRVALAREEKAAAEEYAKTTAIACEAAAQALAKIESQLEGE